MDLSLWASYPALQQELTKTEQIMTKQISVKNPDFESGIQELISGNGKMLRAALLLEATNFGTQADENDKFEKAAASIEVIHLASLVHDDVIDDSDLRRGKATLNFDFGQHDAIYLGDYLFTQYFELLLQYAPDFANLQYNVQGMKEVLEGELEQSTERFDLTRTDEQYFDSIRGKTAELFRVAMGEGAIISGADDERVAIFEQIGLKIGMAFQIRDDLRDFEPAQETSKPTLNDVQNGVYTLPIIEALKTDYDVKLIPLLKKDQLSSADLDEIMQIVEESDGMMNARAFLKDFLDGAAAGMQELPASPNRDTLETIVQGIFF